MTSRKLIFTMTFSTCARSALMERVEEYCFISPAAPSASHLNTASTLFAICIDSSEKRLLQAPTSVSMTGYKRCFAYLSLGLFDTEVSSSLCPSVLHTNADVNVAVKKPFASISLMISFITIPEAICMNSFWVS